MPTSDHRPTARTLLEQLIKERRQTYEEFAHDAERFAREHRHEGTISVRHLQRLAAGRRNSGHQLGPLRPATARLLEAIFGIDADTLLAPPQTVNQQPHPLRVAVSVVRKGSAVLLVRRRTDPSDPLAWQFPAGIIKPGEAASAVAVQDTLDETGVHCTVVRPLGSRVHPHTRVHCEYILCRRVLGEPTNRDRTENIDAVWVDLPRLHDFIPAEQIFTPTLEALTLPG